MRVVVANRQYSTARKKPLQLIVYSPTCEFNLTRSSQCEFADSQYAAVYWSSCPDVVSDTRSRQQSICCQNTSVVAASQRNSLPCADTLESSGSQQSRAVKATVRGARKRYAPNAQAGNASVEKPTRPCTNAKYIGTNVMQVTDEHTMKVA